MENNIESLKKEMAELNSEISEIEKKNKKTTRIRNIKIFGKRLQKYLPHIVAVGTLIGTYVVKNQLPTVNIPFPSFLTNDGSNNVEVSIGFFYLLLAYYGAFYSDASTKNKDICDGAITNIRAQYPLINDRDLRHQLMEVRSEYRKLESGKTK